MENPANKSIFFYNIIGNIFNFIDITVKTGIKKLLKKFEESVKLLIF